MSLETIHKGGHGKVAKYIVEKKWTPSQELAKMNTYVQRSQIDKILDHDADVYVRVPSEKEGEEKGEEKLLLRFRKGALSKDNIDSFYENIIDFAHHTSENRGNASGNNSKRGVAYNKSVKSNILGFFDRWSPSQKRKFRDSGNKAELDIRPCRFNVEHPEKYQHLLPLLKEIDNWYERLVPDCYQKQARKARSIPVFHIPGTSFTTITTNINYRTSIHTDKGDDEEGFGNLVVLERGKYEGGETCFPQYGLGVDVRQGDILFMDVHEPHGNLPMKSIQPAEGEKEAIRLSVVCYLRKQIWEKTRGKTHKQLRDWHDKFLEFSGVSGTVKGEKGSKKRKTVKKRGGGSDGIFSTTPLPQMTGLLWGH
jgi:hypothetical protein